jgi:hypothetical protein
MTNRTSPGFSSRSGVTGYELSSAYHTKAPSFADLCCFLVIFLEALKRSPASIQRRGLDLLLNAAWYQPVG